MNISPSYSSLSVLSLKMDIHYNESLPIPTLCPPIASLFTQSNLFTTKPLPNKTRPEKIIKPLPNKSRPEQRHYIRYYITNDTKYPDLPPQKPSPQQAQAQSEPDTLDIGEFIDERPQFNYDDNVLLSARINNGYFKTKGEGNTVFKWDNLDLMTYINGSSVKKTLHDSDADVTKLNKKRHKNNNNLKMMKSNGYYKKGERNPVFSWDNSELVKYVNGL